MKRLKMLVGLGLAVLGSGVSAENTPVLVELFTSEGCSSCPPADNLLQKLDRGQPIAGVQVIVLSEHVDYWNRIGWADPYSSAAFSARQQVYARRFNTSGPYTPQMVVNGRTEFVGSDGRAAEAAIRDEARVAKTEVRIGAGEKSATIEVDALPVKTARKANVFLAYAADEGSQDVLRGENKGRRLHHVAIVKELKQIGTVDGHTGFHGEATVEKGMRMVVFAQEPGNGPVWGVAMRAAGQ
jgi:hypothetical protein